MWPDFLTSEYRQYKTDTDTVATWLAKTAKQTGYAIENIEIKDEKPSTGRLKGKARKQAAQKSSVKKFIIPIKDFTTLAEHIASKSEKKSSTIKAPIAFVSVLDRAISLRKSHGHSVSEQLPDSAEKILENESHSYFVTVLEKVRQILKPVMPTETENAENVPDPDDLANMYETLELQEPSEAFLQAPPAAKRAVSPGPHGEPSIKYESERVDDIREALIALDLILQDLTKFRNVINQGWANYTNGIFDLTSLSIMTNTAIDFARSLEEDARDLIAPYGSVHELCNRFYGAHCMLQQEDVGHREQEGDELNFKTYEAADSLFLPAFMMLDNFRRNIIPGRVLHYKEGHFGVYDPKSDREKKTHRERFQEDKIIIAELLPELQVICTLTQSDYIPAEDNFLGGMRRLLKNGELPLWLAFSATILLDIHHLLRQDVKKPFNVLRRASTVISISIKRALGFHEGLRPSGWPKSNDRAFDGLLSEINELIFKDPLQQIKYNQGLTETPFRLISNHPVWCGLWLYRLKARYHEISVQWCNAWGSVLYTNLLYRSIQQQKTVEGKEWEDILPKRWLDMDMATMLQGEEKMFVGAPPKSADDALKQFVLMIGGSATAFAKNGRNKNAPEPSKRGPKQLQELATVASLFKSRYGVNGDAVHKSLTPSDVERILSGSHWEEDTTDEDGKDKEYFVLDKVETTKSKKRWQETKKIAPSVLLEKLRNALMGELPELSFPWMDLHRNSWIALDVVRKGCDGHLIRLFGPGYIENESQLPYVVGYILMLAAGQKKIRGLSPQKSAETSSGLMLRAGQTLGLVIGEKDNGQFCTKEILEKQFGVQHVEEEELDKVMEENRAANAKANGTANGTAKN